MGWFHDFVKWHPMMSGAMGMAIANAVVTTLPTPRAEERWYGYLFNLLHAVVFAFARIASQYSSEGAK